MFAIPGILALIVFIYVRPQEFWEPLNQLPLLYIFLGLAVFGQILDLKLRISKPRAAPQLILVILFFIWCIITMALWGVKNLVGESIVFAVAIVLFFTPAHAIQSFRMLHYMAATLLGVGIFLAVVGIHQAHAPWGCIILDPTQAENVAVGVPDGRPCKINYDCYTGDPEPGADYLCERVGLFGTTTVGQGRVRYRGILQDPNELSLALAITVPFAFIFFERRRSLGRGALLFLSFGLVALATFYTKSRGGQLVLAAVIGTYFIRRFKWKGIVMSMMAAAPMLLLGGRGGAEADKSTLERLEAWYEGMNMFRQNPAYGMGMTQFTEHHWLTAHNAYILAAAELGFIGLFLFVSILYVTIKTPVIALWRYRNEPTASIATTWGWALLAGWVGTIVGIGLLSFTYHYVLWIHIGVTGAFYSCVKAHDPEFKVRYGVKDFLLTAFATAGLIALLFVYTRIKAPH